MASSGRGEIRPGEIYIVYTNRKSRPVIVVSRPELNRGPIVLAVPVTTAHWSMRRHQPHCVAFRAGEFGFTENCVAKADEIQVYDTESLDRHRGVIGRISEERLDAIRFALWYVVDGSYVDEEVTECEQGVPFRGEP